MQQLENLNQKILTRLLETATTVIDRFGLSETNDALQLKLTENVLGVPRRIIGDSISQTDDSSTVWTFRTLEGDYLKVQNIHRDDSGNTTKNVTALEVNFGEITKFDPGEARYSLEELTARLRGETTEGRKEEMLKFFELEEASLPVIVRLPMTDTEYVNQMLDREGYPIYNVEEFAKQVKDFENNPNEFQQFESLCRIAETFRGKIIPHEELRIAKMLQVFSPEQIDRINDYLELSVFQTRIEGFKVPYSLSVPIYREALNLDLTEAKKVWRVQNKEEQSPEDLAYLRQIKDEIAQLKTEMLS